MLSLNLRPETLQEFIGQEHLVGPKGVVSQMLAKNYLPSLVFWGPPASGKTTLANIIAKQIEADFFGLSAVSQGKDELRKIIQTSKQNKDYGRRTVLFLDEIHRWNKAQQDSLLPFVESGQIILIGATTENPSFSINAALLSRCRVLVFKTHTTENLTQALKKGWSTLNISDKPDEKLLKYIAELADGDMRFALNTLEIAAQIGKIDEQAIVQAAQKSLLHDKSGEQHYNLISAVHKSLRSSNATAGVYWIMRMLQAGEDPLYIARRLLRFASEDIGNTNPNALLLANQVFLAVQNLGMPECETALVQLAEYLANSPKNNSAYMAASLAKKDIMKYGSLPVPLHFRNAPTKLMKELDYGKNYQYDHDLPGKKSNQQCMPDELKNRNYFKKDKAEN